MSAAHFDTEIGAEALRPVLREVPLGSAYFKRRAYAFLESCGLQPPEHLDHLVACYDEETEQMLACCALDGSTIKCLAVAPEARHLHLAAALVSHLTDRACRMGIGNVTAFTKPDNLQLFRSMGFHLIGSAPEAVMLESDPRALTAYTDYLRSLRKEGRSGAIVMNANPLTRGHLYLIEQARAAVDHLYVVLVADNPLTLFGYDERRNMLQNALAALPNVTLVEGSIYSVSAATFPSYFIKTKTAATAAHIALDLDIFGRHLAPALGVTVRFVGSEPLDSLTAAYNQGMHRLLPDYGIEVVEIPRLRIDSEQSPYLSATALRSALQAGRSALALHIAAPSAAPYVLAKAAARALQDELDLTPKPGLVDRHNSGAHTDMDHALMSRSIRALEPAFARVALAAHRPEGAAAAALQAIGLEAEARMLAATQGVNTHKGALFAFGLVTATAARLLAARLPLTPEALQNGVARLAQGFVQPPATHGAQVCRQYRVSGALANALTGYARLFDNWLPYYRSLEGSEHAEHRLLLRIMADLDDTNVIHRAGIQAAASVKRDAERMLQNFDLTRLQQLDADYISRHISPGGCADMFALTRYVNGLCPSAQTNR